MRECASITTGPRSSISIARGGPVDEPEMRRTFNLGVGLVVVVADGAAEKALEALVGAGERAWLMGEIVAGPGEPDVLVED